MGQLYGNWRKLMRIRRIAGIVAAAALAMSFGGATVAASTTDTTNVSLTITPGSELSVDITSSTNFQNQPFNLNSAPGNYSYSAAYNYVATDLRGTGAGWIVTASASAFTPAVPGSGMSTGNNTQWNAGCGFGTGFCPTAGSISNGVDIHHAGANIIAAPASILWSIGGHTAAPQPYGTGSFGAQEAVYYTGFPVAVQAGTYTSTITLT